MGAFYGSVQVRAEDRDRVKAAADEVARHWQIRMLIGPVLNGWVGVYPEGSGQDGTVSRDLAQRISGDVLHFLVHDEDIFAYWLYRDGRLVDSFHSRPGYFGEKGRAEEERMVGNAEAFRPLIGDRIDQLRPLLAREGRPWPMESDRLGSFAGVLGIRNALTSYEYLKEDDHSGITGWRKFEELPADEVTNAKDRKRQAKERLKNAIQQLKADGLLLDRKFSRPAQAFACALGSDLLVAWSEWGKDVSMRLYRALRKTPEAIPVPTSAPIWKIVSDAAGQRVAINAPRCVRVCDVAAGDATARDAAARDAAVKDVTAKDVVAMPWKHVCDIPAPEGVGGLAISADGRLVAHSSGRRSIITDVATGRPLLEIPDHSFEHATFHPSGEWLALGHPACDLISLNTEPHWRRVVDLPKRGATWPLAQVVNLSNADIEDIIEQGRRFPVLGTYAAGFSRDGRWYWRAAVGGLFVYEWSAIGLAERAELPEATWQFALPSTGKQPFEIVYAVAQEPDAAAVVFGGMTGRLYRLHLESGDVRELIKLPSECHIHSLTFSGDGSTLAVVAQAYPLSEEAPEIGGTIWEVWNYRLLCDGGAGTKATE
jgi:hypothetical protein